MSGNSWVRFIRNYGPIPTNDNMYDETIQRALSRYKIKPLVLPAQFLEQLLVNFTSDSPRSQILTGTAGDGKTYHCREVWRALGGSEVGWNIGEKIQRLAVGDRQLIIVKDLSELRDDESATLLEQMAVDLTSDDASRIYLIAANHGQLLEKLKAAPDSATMQAFGYAVEELLVTGDNPNPNVHLGLSDLSRAPAAEMIGDVIKAMTEHEGWDNCEACPSHTEGGPACPIRENRARLSGEIDSRLFRRRLTDLIEISEHNGGHFPVRQLLALVANVLLGHPDARDGLMSCADVPGIIARDSTSKASVYRNVFGENLKPSRAEKTELFRKLNLFGVGAETSNRVDNLLVYGADDPELSEPYRNLVLSDGIYGGTAAYAQAQRAYLEGEDTNAKDNFLGMLRTQRQRLFFTLPESDVTGYELWDLTVFRYAGLYLDVANRLAKNLPLPRTVMPLIMRGLNRIFTGMLVQNHDELVLATSGSHSQSKTSPLLDELISVPRQGGEEATLVADGRGGFGISVRVSRGDDPGPIHLPLSATRFEFLGRVSEGALPSSFSLECHEDLLAFKARLLSATERRRVVDGDESPSGGELVLRFIELSADGRASPRRVTVRA